MNGIIGQQGMKVAELLIETWYEVRVKSKGIMQVATWQLLSFLAM